MTTRFDPIDYAQQLEAAGVPKAQAEVHAQTLARLVGSCVAHPNDLLKLALLIRQELKALDQSVALRFEALEERVALRFESLEERLKLQFKSLRMELSVEIATLDAKFTGELKQVRWMINTVVLMNIALLIKIFLP